MSQQWTPADGGGVGRLGETPEYATATRKFEIIGRCASFYTIYEYVSMVGVGSIRLRQTPIFPVAHRVWAEYSTYRLDFENNHLYGYQSDKPGQTNRDRLILTASSSRF